MRQSDLQSCRKMLLDLRERLTDEVDRLVEHIPDQLVTPGELSHSPTHRADLAVEGLDREIAIIQQEQGFRAEVLAALQRLEEGSYGRCQECGTEIASARLKAVPYAATCIDCAVKAEGN